MKLRFALPFILLLLALAVHGQSVNELKKQSEKDMQQMRSRQDQLMTQMQQGFDAFVKKADKDFANFLKQNWQDFEVFRSKKEPLQPKPVVLPHFQPEQKPAKHKGQEIIPLAPASKNTEINPPTETPPVPVIPKATISGERRIRFDFYGKPVSEPYDPKMQQLFPRRYDQRTMGKWWMQYSRTNYGPLVKGLLQTKQHLALNDWGYFQLVKQAARSLVPGNRQHALLFSWFIMIHSGYDMKIASSGGTLHLLFPSVQEVYERKYLKIQDRTYYFDQPATVNTFQTYDYVFPGATRRINFRMTHEPLLGGDVSRRKISFTYQGHRYGAQVVSETENIRFLQHYPTTALQVYFHGLLPEASRQSLVTALSPILKNMDKSEKLDFLLHFVQSGFAYETDQQQFGREKFFFPEEMLYYKASDCEDRAVFFSWLVHYFLHLKVIGLVYPDHVATAVALPGETMGDYVMFLGQKYIVADPTYIGAPVGMAMPRYARMKTSVIPVF